MLDFQTLTVPSSPNTWLIAPEGFLPTAKPDVPSPLFTNDAETVFSVLSNIVKSAPRLSNVEIDPGQRRLHYTVRVQLTPFKDDVDLAVVEVDGGTSLIAYSRSRTGHSDLGVNKRRVEGLLTYLRQRLETS